MVFKFLLTVAFVPFAWAFAELFFELLLWLSKKATKKEEKTLFQMLKDGELETEVSFPAQFALLSATDEEGEEVEIEALQDGFDQVDIDRYKRKLESIKGKNNTIVLEI